MAFEDSEKDSWCEYSSAIWFQILFLVDAVAALFCLTDSYKHHLGLIVLQSVHLGISLFLFALSFGRLKSIAITMKNVLIVAFVINSGSLIIVLWEFIQNHVDWAKNEHKEYMFSIYLFCRYGAFVPIYSFILYILYKLTSTQEQHEEKNNLEKY